MLSYEEALSQILAVAQPLPTKWLPLSELLGYVLAAPISARFDLPSFDNSAVDGYGVKLTDVQNASTDNPVQLKLLGEMRAGGADDFSSEGAGVAGGAAIKILTGAIVPTSIEAVVMREYCEEVDGHVRVTQSARPGENIRRRGGEVKAGSQVLRAGLRISPPVLALIATVGEQQALVHAKPRIAIVITGDELVPPGSELKSGQIFDSNSYALRGASECLGLEVSSVFYAKDSLEETKAAFSRAMEVADVVLSSGGVSVGDHDYVKSALEELQVETIFWRIAIKPGKPVYFGTSVGQAGTQSKKLIFGLPGNPVSVLVTYHQFVKPALKKLMGMTDVSSPKYTARITSQMNKKAGRLDFLRAKMTPAESGIEVTPAKSQDSHMLTGLADADCLAHFAADAETLAAGTNIPIQFLNWFE